MRVIGIDASTKKTGVCLFDNGKYAKHIRVDYHTNTE